MKKNIKKILPSIVVVMVMFIATTAHASVITGTLNTQGGVNPAIPTGLTTSNPAKGDTSINVSWNSVAFVGGYNLYRIKDGALATFVASTTSTNYSNTGLTDGNYSYQIESYLGSLTSGTSTPTIPATIDTSVTPAGGGGTGGTGGGGGGGAPTTPPTTDQADFNSDGNVNILDFNVLITNWGTTSGATKATGDTNGDGKVDIYDFNLLIANWQS